MGGLSRSELQLQNLGLDVALGLHGLLGGLSLELRCVAIEALSSESLYLGQRDLRPSIDNNRCELP